jgi:streptogramin lyase
VTPAGGGPTRLAVGPDGNLWFGDYISDSINRVTTAGALTTIKLPESGKDDTEPSELLNASGTLWVSTTHKLFIVDTTPDPTTTTVAGATSTTVAGATTSTVVGTAPAATPTDAQPTFTG